MSIEDKFGKLKSPADSVIDLEKIQSFGRRLYMARLTLGKTRKEIASEVHLNKGSIERYENGTVFPKEDKLPAIALAYGLNLEELIRDFNISREAHKVELDANKHYKKSKTKRTPREYEGFGPGSSGNRGHQY